MISLLFATPIGGRDRNWMLYGGLLDIAAPWVYGVVHVKEWNKGPSEWLEGNAQWLHVSIEFMDARIGRIMTIVVALILSSGVLPNWTDLSGACRARAMIMPAVLIFSYLPYMVRHSSAMFDNALP